MTVEPRAFSGVEREHVRTFECELFADLHDVHFFGDVYKRQRKRRVKTPPTPFEPLDIGGKIVIAFYNLRTQRFAHGVRFLNLPKRTEDEIQRFIHLYQLKQLRERAERDDED